MALVAFKVDLLITVGTRTAPYARDATTSIPVVDPGRFAKATPTTSAPRHRRRALLPLQDR